jgi:tetratricopeptide (TPR) repeat protein
MNGADGMESLRRRHLEIRETLERVEREQDARERGSVRADILQLFRDTERLAEELAAFREEIRPLLERYKRLFPRPAPVAPGAGMEAARVDHLGSSTHRERAWSAMAAGDDEGALAELGRALELAPGDPAAAAMEGWARARLGRLDEARHALDAVLARDPRHPLALTARGYLALRSDDWDGARDCLRRVLDDGSDRLAVLYANLYLGAGYANRGAFREAQGLLTRALQLGPNLIEAYWELGRTQYLEGDLAAASETWRRGGGASRFSPWAERCAQAADRLAAGEPVPLQ